MKKTKKLTNRIFAIMMMSVFLASGNALLFSVPSYARSEVKMGQASSGESGIKGQKAGDQKGSEVSIDSWAYESGSGDSYHWVYVFRAKDPAIAKKLAENMIAAANNNHIGYDQNTPDRNTLYDEAEKVGWDISAITTNCETTCASVVSVCLNAAGVKVPRTWYSGIVYEGIMATDQFYCYTDKAYTASDELLLPGDILCNPDKHTAMVVESPNRFTFEVKYSDTKGEEQSVFVEDGKTVRVSLNNGEQPQSFEAGEVTDLKQYEPKKARATFKGWEKLDDETFSAKYEDKLAHISISGGEIKEIKEIK